MATAADLEAYRGVHHAELIGGVIVEKSSGGDHANAHTALLHLLGARYHLVDKLRVYQRRGVAHDWIVDPMSETLTVYRLAAGEYVLALTAKRGERVRAEPFAEIELAVGALFGDEEPAT